MKRIAFLLLTVLTPITLFGQSTKGYYRFPTIHQQTVVFTSEGDLWKVGIDGGVAQRLTTHHGVESHPAISPDGRTVAFSAQYEGPTEVYTMPIAGGLPTRKTFEGETARVIGWTPAGKILYSTRHYSTLPNTQLAIIGPDDNEPTLVPLSQASDGAFDPIGNTLFFTRLPFQGSQTKRYKGGTAQNLWKFKEGTPEAVPLTADYAGTSKAPMWWKGRVYFASDRDGTMNIWSMDENGQSLRQHTTHNGWDVQSPSLHNDQIVFQLGADIRIFEIETGADRVLPITLASDFDQTRERWIQEPMQYVTDVHVSPNGDRIALTSRGRIFVAPVKEGRLVEATRKQGVRYRNARFMPDGKSLLLLSDETGELEFWKMPATGIGETQKLTSDGKVLRWEGVPSPDGRLFAYTNKDQQLWLYDLESQKSRLIGESKRGNFFGLVWSPDSKWLAYSANAKNRHSQLRIYQIQKGTSATLTSDRVDSYSPAWSPDGEWLYFLSDRHFQSLVRSPWGPRQPEPFLDKTTKIYAVALTKGERFPFLASDELQESEDSKRDSDKNSEKSKKDDSQKSATVHIDLDEIERRVMEVPVEPGNYQGLAANDQRLFWAERETSIQRKRKLVALQIDNKEIKPKTLVEDIRSYELSDDGKRIMVRKDDDIYVLDANKGKPDKLSDQKVDLKSWKFSINPAEEWRQMFVDAWRLERDFFYDRNLHNVDWKGLLDKHLRLVDRVADRDELNDLISQLVGELAALHIYVRGGDRRRGEDSITPASLGAKLTRDESSRGYRIAHIYQTEPDYIDRLAPLARPQHNIQEGDVILAINGLPTLSVEHLSVLLRNQAGKQVRLRIKSKSSGQEFDAVVKPISARAASNLRYDEWEYTRRLMVEEGGNGDIGYVHMRAMGGNNYPEWVRNFYPVYDRKGLIVDMRHNRGGNIDSWILEKLLRKAWFYWAPRVGDPTWNMQYAFRGHMVVLCNERTASDGEAFTEGFRRLGLGKVIGTRTWGGEIWLSFNNRLVDGGIASAAQTGVYGPEGEWLIEGHGVDPDIVVDNLPHATFNGEDAQLAAAIKHLQELMKADPRDVPPPPPYPDKSFDYTKSTNGQRTLKRDE
ncbi:S41 family peptidase [bacterium]|nr:S41 family peptidase [bacterium]